jgi:CDP-diacylglycerol--serine O-phosphatidyltransferase
MLEGNGPMARHFSMLRDFTVADFLTLGNAACGVAALFAAIAYVETSQLGHFYAAVALGPASFLFDALDGRVARWRREHSAMGRELDSLADVISFGVAPAVIGYAAGLRGGWDRAILIGFVACGVSRLARYNVTAEALADGADKVPYFEGAPIPTSIWLTGLLALLAATGRVGAHMWLGRVGIGPFDLHPMSLLFGVHGALMVSKTIHIPKP